MYPSQALCHTPIAWRPRGVVGSGQQAGQKAQNEGLDFSEPSEPRGGLPSSLLVWLVPLVLLPPMILGMAAGGWSLPRPLGGISPLRLSALQNPPQYTPAKLSRAQPEKQPNQTEREHSGRRTVLIDDENCHG